jgi:hypothetical protein
MPASRCRPVVLTALLDDFITIGRNGFAEAKSDQGGGIRIDVIPWAGGRRSRAGTTN